MLDVFILYGPPGVGKGTISKHFPPERVISVGAAIRRAGIVTRGEMISAEASNQILYRELSEKQSEPYVILDGYPRNKAQIDFIGALDYMVNVRRFFNLLCSDKTIFRRTALRETCLCGQTFHSQLRPSRVKGICDFCYEPLFCREDDKADRIQYRLKMHHRNNNLILNAFCDVRADINMENFDGVLQTIYLIDPHQMPQEAPLNNQTVIARNSGFEKSPLNRHFSR